MYNEKTKAIFLESLPTEDMQRMFISIFKRTEPYEAKQQKDVSMFDMKECMDLLVDLNPKSSGHIGSLLSQFNKYAEWTIKGSDMSKNYWGLIPVDESYATQSFASRYVKDLDELSNIVDIGLESPFDKYVVYLLFAGIMGEGFSELTQIKDTDVDLLGKTINTNRRRHSNIPEYLVKIAASNDYYEERKPRDYASPYFVKPYKTKHLLGEPIAYQGVHRVFQKLNKNYNRESGDAKEFTPTTIWRSGLFSSLHNLEQLKGDLVTDDFIHVSEVYGNKNSFSSYARDYELYKNIIVNSDRK